MGIPVRPMIMLRYVISALIALAAGLLTASSLLSINTRIVNSTLLYDIILVVVIGGIGLSGGKGGIRNVIVGALLIGIMLNAMTIIDISNIYQNLIKSTILLVAIIDRQPAQTRATNKPRSRATSERHQRKGNIMNWRKLCAAALGVAMLTFAAPVQAEEDPGPAAYQQALKGKRVALVPMAMGFDLAQGWAAYLKREVEGWGGVFETRDPNWSVEAGAQAITDLINSEPHPDVLVVHSPDLNSYVKLLKKAQAKGIYVILIDNPMNFAADAFIGSDWDRLGQLEAEAAVKVCGENSSKKIGLVQGDQVNASSLYQYAGIMKVLEKYPDFKVVAKPDSNWDATTARNVTATMLQQNPDICAIIDFWDGDATGHRGGDPRRRQGGQDRAHHDGRRREGRLRQAPIRRVHRRGHDRTAQPVARHERDHQVPAAERPAAGNLEDLYLHAGARLHEGRPQARHLLGREGAAGGVK